jgi:hypothetical protein
MTTDRHAPKAPRKTEIETSTEATAVPADHAPTGVDGVALLRTSSAVVAALVPTALLVVVAVTIGPRLGDTLASHWSGGGPADGFSGTWSSFAVVAVIVAVLTAVSVAAALTRRGRPSRLIAGGAASFAGLVACAWVATALATAAAPTPEEAVAGWTPLLSIAGLAWGVVVGVLATGSGVRAAADLEVDGLVAVRPVALRPGERLAWSGTTGSRVFLVMGSALIVGAIVGGVVLSSTGASSAVVYAAVLLIAGVAVLALGRVRLTIDRRGVRLVSALFGVRLLRVRLEDVAGVDTETLDPLSWGGWGLRVSKRGTAYVTGRRPGIVVRRRDGSAVAVTIDDAESAASVAAALAGR